LCAEQEGIVPEEFSRAQEERLLGLSEPLADRTGGTRAQPVVERCLIGAGAVRVAQEPLEQEGDPEVTVDRSTGWNERPGVLPAEAARGSQTRSCGRVVDLLPEQRREQSSLLLLEQATERTTRDCERLAQPRREPAIERRTRCLPGETAEEFQGSLLDSLDHRVPQKSESLCRPSAIDRGYQPKTGSSVARATG